MISFMRMVIGEETFETLDFPYYVEKNRYRITCRTRKTLYFLCCITFNLPDQIGAKNNEGMMLHISTGSHVKHGKGLHPSATRE